MKTKIDIEKLVQWALRDELPKGRPVSAEIGFAIGRRLRARPSAIARSFGDVRETDALGFVAGEPHNDAEIVSDAIAMLPTTSRFESEIEVRNLFGDLVLISASAFPLLLGSIFNPQALVSLHAAMGTRPRWQFACPTPRQMFVAASPAARRRRPLVHGIDAKGNLVEVRRNEGKRRRLLGEFSLSMSPRSPIDWGSEPLAIGEARAEYVAWRFALVSLVRDLAGKLDQFEPIAPAAAVAPWIIDDEVMPKIVGVRDLVAGYKPPAPRNRPVGKPVESPIEAETVAAYNRASRTKMKKIATV